MDSKLAIKTTKVKFHFILISILSVIITFLIFLSSAELIFNRDFPLIESISASSISEEIDYKISQSMYKSYSYNFDTLFEGRDLRYIEIPALNQKLELTRAINQDEAWKNKGNKANYLVIKNSKEVDNIIVYFKESWRTILNTSSLKLGDFIFLKTNDEWNYIFRIESINQYSVEERFPIKSYDAMNVTLLIENSDTNSYKVIEAKIVSSRGS